MADYISREAAVKALERLNPSRLTMEIFKAIEKVPSADVEPVVRCRECVSYGADEYGDIRCNCPWGMDFPGDNDFCSYGQRRDQSADVRNMDGGNPDGQ